MIGLSGLPAGGGRITVSRVTGAGLIAMAMLAATQAVTAAEETAAVPGNEFPVREIPNIPPAGEAYFSPDNIHIITGTKDPDAIKNKNGTPGGLERIFTDTGTEITRINDHGQDACSYFFPDGKRVAWTSTRDHMDWPVADWSDPEDYPTGGEIYTSDLKGNHIVRLTNNKFYEAEEYHRDYYKRNSDQPYCEVIINPKLMKVQEEFAALLKSHEK